MTEREIIDIHSLNSGKSINISNSLDDITEINMGGSKSSNFGSGIELLMNDKKKSGSSDRLSQEIDINDLTNLEDELNDLSGISSNKTKSVKHSRSDIFSSGFKLKEDVLEDGIYNDDLDIHEPLNLGASTKNQSQEEKNTWDGYGKFNDIPINPDMPKSNTEPKMSKEELLKDKFIYLQKLENIEKKGIKLTKKYDMESNLLEMKGDLLSLKRRRKTPLNFKEKG